MTIPALVIFFVFMTIPMIMGIFYSFTNSPGYGSFGMVGLDNYINMFKDPRVLESYLFTFKYAIITTIFVNVIALSLALMLNSKIPAKNGFRALFFFPNVLPLLIIGYIFTYLFTNNLPAIASSLGWTGLEQSLLVNEQYAWLAIAFVGIWQGIAFTTIIYISGLQTVPAELFEASSLDGASKWSQFLHVTLPLIAPFVTINMVLSFKNNLGVSDLIFAMTGGGPGTSTESIPFLIYKTGFEGGDYAYQTANAVIYFIVIVLVSVFQLKFFGRQEKKMS
ncbi:sugar ABC transporter permease [Micrococcales bacterium 31B]|nr:sugar ABC transporter permease [Micrococcales bacterium 31B]